jgi:hypothetical protein
VIRLRVIHNDIVYGRGVDNPFEPFKELAKKPFLANLYQRGLLGSLDNIGVVGGSVLGLHDDVEYPDVEIQRADPIDAVFDKKRL